MKEKKEILIESRPRRFGKSTLGEDSFIVACEKDKLAEYHHPKYVCMSRKMYEDLRKTRAQLREETEHENDVGLCAKCLKIKKLEKKQKYLDESYNAGYEQGKQETEKEWALKEKDLQEQWNRARNALDESNEMQSATWEEVIRKEEREKGEKEMKEKILKDCFWLLDCEEDCLKTSWINDFEIKVINNIRERFKGHFNNLSTSTEE